MRQPVDVLAVFDIGAVSPRPIRFKVLEHGIKTTVRVTDIRNIEIVYDCTTVSDGRHIDYKLLYFYRECKWELETS